MSFFHVEGAGCSLPATQFPLAFVGLPRQTAPATTAPCRTAGVVDFIEVCAAAHVTSDLSCETGQSSRCLTRRNNRSINSSRNGGELLGGLHPGCCRGPRWRGVSTLGHFNSWFCNVRWCTRCSWRVFGLGGRNVRATECGRSTGRPPRARPSRRAVLRTGITELFGSQLHARLESTVSAESAEPATTEGIARDHASNQ
jgi:hypothetical protein